jgi:methylenetetrahydrofolate dehydrogenase (NADP+) / methenyltetrahydrofolate cyclohydrolase
MLLSGKGVANQIFEATKKNIDEHKLTPGLAVLLVGDDAPSHLYVGIKERRAKELGILFEKKFFPTEVSEDVIVQTIVSLNERDDIDGIIVQLPLPEHLDTDRIIASIEPSKDTDGFHPVTIAKFLAGDVERLPVFPRAMLELVRSAPKMERKKGIALVNSELMGEVLEKALTDEGLEAEYILKNNQEKKNHYAKEADVILSATGNTASLSLYDCKTGTVVIDGGISYDEKGEVIGDVTRDDGVYREDTWVTPVPGGVGPVTVAVLLARVTEASLRKIGK